MIIKPASGRSADIEAIEVILGRDDLAGRQRSAIEVELKKIRAGAKGENDAAYQIDFHLREAKNWMVLHDLRLEVDGDVAQIDHLVINRFLQVFACETKNFGEGLSCNDHGEWVGYHKGRPFGIPSPLKQNERHLAVLKRFFKIRRKWHPKRLGLQIEPDLRSLVLVGNGARIGRPKKASIAGMESVAKIEAFMDTINIASDKLNPFLAVGGMVSAKTLQAFAEGLAAEHAPVTWNWEAKFGLEAPGAEGAGDVADSLEEVLHAAAPAKDVAAHCERCGVGVDKKVAWFCRRYKRRFEGKILCRDCQAE